MNNLKIYGIVLLIVSVALFAATLWTTALNSTPHWYAWLASASSGLLLREAYDWFCGKNWYKS